jgi:GABA permease
MITIGGMIGAGLFVGSSAAIAVAGPAVVFSYLITGLIVLLVMRTAMSAIILPAVLSCLNTAFYVCSRVLFVLARCGDAPAWLVQLSGRRVPTRSVLTAAAAGIAGVLAADIAPQAVFAFRVNSSAAVGLFVYILIGISQIRLRRARERAGIPTPSIAIWLFHWASYIAIGGILAVLIAMAMSPQHVREIQTSVLTLVVVLLAYGVMRIRRNGRAVPATSRAAAGTRETAQ